MIRSEEALLYRNGISTASVDLRQWLTREEAVVWLTAWLDMTAPKYNLDFSFAIKRRITSGLENVYLTGMVDELIERIRNSNDDPITVVANFYYEMDDILAMSDDDHFITHRFASFMENAAHDALFFLQKKEKEMYENERRRMDKKAWQRG